MQELHLPDGKPVAINPEAIAYLHALGEQATLIGFAGGGTVTVQGGYEEVLVELGLLDALHEHDEDGDAPESDHDSEDAPHEDDDPAAEERALRENQRGFF